MKVDLTQETINAIKAIMVIDPKVLKEFTTIELGENSLRVLNSISWQLKRLADAWETKPANDKDEGTVWALPAFEESVKDNSKLNDKQRWSKQEIQTVLNLLEQGLSVKEIADKIGRTEMAVYSKINAIGKRLAPRKINYPRTTISWTAEEDQKLALAVSLHGTDWVSIQKVFPNRTREAIRSRWKIKMEEDSKD